ncbi:MAG: outer membrane beta-barrel protein, partial [Bacteroidales bacterium]|nr:outer membrane beta-barrel protein [Bacteroidales bacterium]
LDSTQLQEAACSNAGVFVVPCTEDDVLIRFTHVAHDTLWVRPTESDLGTIMLKDHNTQMQTATVVAPPWTGRNVTLSFQFVDSFTAMDMPINKLDEIRLVAESDTTKEFPPSVMQTHHAASNVTAFQFGVPARPGDYILTARYEGYEPVRMPYHLNKTGRRSQIDEVVRVKRLMPKPEKQYVEDPDGDIIVDGKRMREVMVQATKVQMYYRGDTIVYNADAFMLPDGSMLQDVLKAMPGIEVNGNGEIKVNGRKVDVLQLDSKDLLSGGTEMLLKNLPHYTVDQVKVFEQDEQGARLVGARSVEKEYTLNVTLKKQYKIGWLGEIEMAGGVPTGKQEEFGGQKPSPFGGSWRGLARAFVTRFSEQSRLMVSAMSNNVNNDASNRSEYWNDNMFQTGLQRHNYLSLMYNVYDRQERYENNVFLDSKWTRSESDTRQSSLTYLTHGDTWARLHQTGQSNDFSGKFENWFTLKKPFALSLYTRLDYNRRESNGFSRSAQFNADPASYGDVVAVMDTLMQNPFQSGISSITLSRTRSESQQDGTDRSIRQDVTYNKAFASGDRLRIQPVFIHSQQKGTEHNSYQLDYIQGQGQNDYRHRYNLSPSHSNRFDLNSSYDYNIHSELQISFGNNLIWEHEHKEHERYRLEQTDGWTADKALGALPSTRQLLMQGFDYQNSYVEDHSELTSRYFASLHYNHTRGDVHNDFRMIPSVTVWYEREQYHRDALDTCFSRRLAKPRLQAIFENKLRRKKEDGLNIERTSMLWYEFDSEVPEIQMLLPVRDAYSPQTITLGNPHLRRSYDHRFYLTFLDYYRYRRWNSDGIYENMGARLHIQQNAIATGYTYNPATGVYTYQPTNINGNWDANFNWRHRHVLHKAFAYSVTGNYTYRHSVDLIGGERSTVNSQTVEPSLQLLYKPSTQNQITLTGTWNWTRYDSQRSGFTTRSTLNHQYVLRGQWQLPLDIQFVTDLGLYVRSGYDTPSMNTSDWVWNASLSRSFWKKKLLLKVTGYDILQQINSITQDYNSQGRTETWVRSIPSYVMATLTYKFHVAPKAKK